MPDLAPKTFHALPLVKFLPKHMHKDWETGSICPKTITLLLGNCNLISNLLYRQKYNSNNCYQKLQNRRINNNKVKLPAKPQEQLAQRPRRTVIGSRPASHT